MSQREESFKVHTVKENVLHFPRLLGYSSPPSWQLWRKDHERFSPKFPALLSTRGKGKQNKQPWCLLPALTQALLFLLKDAHPRPPTILLNNNINREAPLMSKETSGPWVLQIAELEITPVLPAPFSGDLVH